MADIQMCLACSLKPATSSNGTVPLCEDCAALVKDSRGVKYQKPTSKTGSDVSLLP